MDNKPLVILLITYKRTAYALRTIDSIFKNLITPHGFSFYVCDDDSPPDHFTAVLERIKDQGGHICGHHSQKLGYGAGCNKGWQVCSQTSPITLWLEDDWELEEPWDMSPYIELLNNNTDIGMVRLGHLPEWQAGEAVGVNGRLYLHLDPTKPYHYSGNPHLKHDRFMLHYGPMPTGLHPGRTETHYDYIVTKKANKGPAIYWPLEIGDRHPWGHIGTIHSYDKGAV